MDPYFFGPRLTYRLTELQEPLHAPLPHRASYEAFRGSWKGSER